MNLYNLIPEEYINEAQGPCWKGYEQIGMKKKGGKQVPNCVPVSEEYDEIFQDNIDGSRNDTTRKRSLLN